MHDDLVDAVKWAIAEKIADPKKIAIMGGSYGGYATLVGMTFTPELFACGVDICGPSNLVTFMEAVPPYWKPILDMFVARIGNHQTEDGKKFLMERSPITRVDKIAEPLLIGQGANDPRVKQDESDQIGLTGFKFNRIKPGQGNPHPVSPWGWQTKGKKTRRNKRTRNMIVQRRK